MMNKYVRIKYILTALMAVIFVSGCANTSDSIRSAESSVAAGRYEEGIKALEVLSNKNSNSKEIHVAILRSRTIASQNLTREARNAYEAGKLDEAEQIYNRLLALDSNNSAARLELQLLHAQEDRSKLIAKAEELFRNGDLEGAERKLRKILLEEPMHTKALALMKQISELQTQSTPPTPVLGPEFKKTISLEFRDSSLKDIFDSIWHASGINFILDRDVRADTKASIYVSEVTIEEAIDALLMAQQLAKKTMSAKTLFIYPRTPQKAIEYQDLVVRNFFLSHVDAKQMQNMLKTILKIKDVYIDEKRNLLVIRDDREGVNLAEKLIRAHDQPEPEVMLALDVIEVKRSKLNEIGISFPNQVALGVVAPLAGTAAGPVTVDTLRNLNGSGLTVGFSGANSGTGQGVIGQINLTDNNGNTNMLANPRIRVRNREKAKIHIGDRLPVVTTTSSGTSTFIGQTVNYLDVGLMLEVEPQVMLDDDVVVKLNLEVSTASQSKVTPGFYDVGTRNTNTVLTIRDGETQVLAGLIRDDERESANRLPGIGSIPLLGRLFSNESKAQDKTEIILAITPHVLHNLIRPSADLVEYSSGTESGQRATASVANVVSAAPLQPAQPVVESKPVNNPSFPAQPQPLHSFSNTAPKSSAAPVPATASNPAASPNTQAGQQSSGVIPMMDFATPPGVGSSPATPPTPP